MVVLDLSVNVFLATNSCSFYVLGCGSGLSGETLTESGHQWIGFDISPSMLGM